LLIIISPPGIAMLPAGIYFASVSLLSFLMSPLSFGDGWTDRNADCCVNNVDEKIPMAKTLVNFGLVTPEILWLICMGDD